MPKTNLVTLAIGSIRRLTRSKASLQQENQDLMELEQGLEIDSLRMANREVSPHISFQLSFSTFVQQA